MESPHVSIIIPLFAADPHYLKLAIQSVIKQTQPSWELILVDDACPKRTGAAMSSALAGLKDRVKVLQLKENCGVSAARNMGASVAKGKWLSFLDQDDMLKPDFLKHCLAVLQAYPQIQVIRVTPEIPLEVDDIRMNALTNSLMTTALIPREVLHAVGGWPMDAIFSDNPYAGEDICLKHMIEVRFVLKTITDRLYFHRCGHGNHTDRFLARSKVMDQNLVIREGQEWDQQLSQHIQQKCQLLRDNAIQPGIILPDVKFDYLLGGV